MRSGGSHASEGGASDQGQTTARAKRADAGDSGPGSLRLESFDADEHRRALEAKHSAETVRAKHLSAERTARDTEAKELREELALEIARADTLQLLYTNVKRSTSWRITAPMREIARLWRRIGRMIRGVDRRRESRQAENNGPSAHFLMARRDPEHKPQGSEHAGSTKSRTTSRGRANKVSKTLRNAAVRKRTSPPSAKRAKALESKLWGGFSRYALEELELLKRSASAPRHEIAYAAWAIAGWQAVHDDYVGALDNLDLMGKAESGHDADIACALLEADCRTRLGEREQARAVITRLLDLHPEEPNLCLAMANTYAPLEGPGDAASDEIRLHWINRVYKSADLLPIAKADPDRPLAIDNLTGACPPKPRPDGDPKVSVIVPAYDAEETIRFALYGLLGQTLQNLEVIIVDDCSTDNTLAIVSELAEADPRVCIIRQPDNQGAYRARNAALRIATGEYVTIHDADDWSHPQRIEAQIDSLTNDYSSNYTDWARTTLHLRFTGTFRGPVNLRSENLSSLLFRRQLLDDIGGWDNVRVAADRELLRRIQRRYGEQRVARLSHLPPLAFAMDYATSLTSRTETHARTLKHGVRQEYHAAAQYWHTSCAPEMLRLSQNSPERPFPAPGVMLPKRVDHVRCDLLVIMDFNMDGGTYHSTMNYLHAAKAHDLSVAALHWPRYDAGAAKLVNANLRQLAHEGKLRIVAPGERVCANSVIAAHPAILSHVMDFHPQIDFDDLIVVVNKMSTRLYSGHDVQYDPLVVRENLMEVFGTEGLWTPVSEHVRRLMKADERYPRPHEQTWIALIDTETWCAALPLRSRARERHRPIVGRHGRDHYTRWPSTPEALQAAYCADRPCDVVILGGAVHALDVIDEAPANWTVHPFGSMDTRAFLSDLDFYVHFPHEEAIEEGAHCAIEAMAAGIPVILPPVFQEHFAEGALYAEPAEVWPLIERLWADDSAYLARAEAGRQFVVANCGWDQLPKRLAKLRTSSPRSRPKGPS